MKTLVFSILVIFALYSCEKESPELKPIQIVKNTRKWVDVFNKNHTLNFINDTLLIEGQSSNQVEIYFKFYGDSLSLEYFHGLINHYTGHILCQIHGNMTWFQKDKVLYTFKPL